MTNYLTSGEHVYIAGTTGAGDEHGGKTATANWWHSNAVKSGTVDASIYVDPKGHGHVAGARARSMSRLAEVWGRGERLIQFTDGSADGHRGVVEFAARTPGKKLLVHDEAHRYAENGALRWALREGGNPGRSVESGPIRSLVVSQHPWDLPEALTNNVPIVIVVGPKRPQLRRYFSTMGIPKAYEDLPEDLPPHAWSVIDGGVYLESNRPVPSKWAGE